MNESLTPFAAAEEWVVAAVRWLRLGVETIGAAGVAFVRARRRHMHAGAEPYAYVALRLTLARYLALALEFQLGADILSTAIAPTWDQIGQLGAVAVIRTALNYFLGKEIEAEAERLNVAEPTDPVPRAGAPR
jgi:uncharacterized membrane protein